MNKAWPSHRKLCSFLLVFFCYLQLNAQFQQPNPPPPTTAYSNVGDCYPGANKWTTKDPQGFGRMFFNAYCQCKGGVASEQQEKQLVATMVSMHKAWKDFMTNDPSLPAPLRSCPKAAGAAAGGSGNGQLSEQEKMRRSIANMRKGLDIVGRARGRAQQLSNDLDRLGNIVNTGDPFEIEQEFNRIMNQIEQMSSSLKSAINQQYMEDGLSTLSDYSDGNMEGALYGGLGMLGSIGENMEAKEQLKKKRQEAIQQKNTAFQQAANQMIDANNAALQKYLQAAAVVLEEDRETYYMTKAIHHSCYANSISSRFNYSNADWAINRCADVNEPVFKRYYAALHEQHYAAAKRKTLLYAKYTNPELHEGAIKHMAAAIALQPQNALYYLEMGRIAKPEDMVLSLSNYLAAYELQPTLFTDSLQKELQQTIAMASSDAAKSILESDVDRIKDYLDADLFDIIRIEDRNMFTYAVKYNANHSASLIYNLEIQFEEGSLKRENMREALSTAAYFGSTECLNDMLNEGADADVNVQGKSLLEYAEMGNRDETFLLLWTASKRKKQNLKQFGEHPIYVKAIAKVDPSAAALGLCSMTQRDLMASTAQQMLIEARQKPYFLNALERCSESKTMILNEPILQEAAQQVFMRSLGQQTSFAWNEDMPSEFPEAVLANLNETQREMIMKELQKGKMQNQTNTGSAQSGEASDMLLEYGFIDPDFLQANAAEITASLVRSDQANTFKRLAQQGLLADKESDGTPIAYAFLNGGSRILNSGAASSINFNATDTSGASVLHSLVFVPNAENASYLINRSGADVNLTGPHGWTPLHFAVREKNIDMVRALLAAGANPKAKDEWGRTPKDIAKERDFDQIKDLF